MLVTVSVGSTCQVALGLISGGGEMGSVSVRDFCMKAGLEEEKMRESVGWGRVSGCSFKYRGHKALLGC